jgi:hypothetical protein
MKEYIMNRKLGTVYSVNPRGWFFIYVTPQERYFAHISELKSERMVALTEKVTFQVSSAPPRKDGQLPCAVDVRIVAEAVQS